MCKYSVYSFCLNDSQTFTNVAFILTWSNCIENGPIEQKIKDYQQE